MPNTVYYIPKANCSVCILKPLSAIFSGHTICKVHCEQYRKYCLAKVSYCGKFFYSTLVFTLYGFYVTQHFYNELRNASSESLICSLNHVCMIIYGVAGLSCTLNAFVSSECWGNGILDLFLKLSEETESIFKPEYFKQILRENLHFFFLIEVFQTAITLTLLVLNSFGSFLIIFTYFLFDYLLAFALFECSIYIQTVGRLFENASNVLMETLSENADNCYEVVLLTQIKYATYMKTKIYFEKYLQKLLPPLIISLIIIFVIGGYGVVQIILNIDNLIVNDLLITASMVILGVPSIYCMLRPIFSLTRIIRRVSIFEYVILSAQCSVSYETSKEVKYKKTH